MVSKRSAMGERQTRYCVPPLSESVVSGVAELFNLENLRSFFDKLRHLRLTSARDCSVNSARAS